jgi:hypothetical protein
VQLETASSITTSDGSFYACAVCATNRAGIDFARTIADFLKTFDMQATYSSMMDVPALQHVVKKIRTFTDTLRRAVLASYADLSASQALALCDLAIGQVFMPRLHRSLFQLYRHASKRQDIEFNKKVRILRMPGVLPQHFGVARYKHAEMQTVAAEQEHDLHEVVHTANLDRNNYPRHPAEVTFAVQFARPINTLAQFHQYSSPKSKLAALVSCCQDIAKCAQDDGRM